MKGLVQSQIHDQSLRKKGLKLDPLIHVVEFHDLHTLIYGIVVNYANLLFTPRTNADNVSEELRN